MGGQRRKSTGKHRRLPSPGARPTMVHVLVADDLPDERELFATFLAMAGYTATAVDSTEAVLSAAFSSSPPDVILLDLVLDRADGLAVVHTLRSDPRTATLPIVAVTAATPRYVEGVALAVGCDGFLTKPCPPAVVAQVLNAARSRRSSA
jgi:CheY-like chemotaxis protein